ncbi:unnamed protein product [Moneuplotes crassus]|uniref:Uncharacterized protein n=1 Tax=Euplotes crassus TaxID=5936 RepID=A0AAD1U4S6_EUPCR|nr:unnamed protein product [Moneuplotes crassus]
MWIKLNHFRRAQNCLTSCNPMLNRNLLCISQRTFARKKVWRDKDPDVIAERMEYYRQITEYRRRHKEDYERHVAEVDSKFWDPDSDQLPPVQEKMLSDLRQRQTNERTSIIKVAMLAKNKIRHLHKREIETEEKNKWHRIKDMQKLRERQMYLQALKIDTSAPVPSPTIVDFTHYYERLQNLAMLTIHGNYSEAEKLLRNEETVEEKNIYLQPLYRNLKKCIRFITKTEEAQITKKYHRLMAGVITGAMDDQENLLNDLKEKYENELLQMKKKDSVPKMKLKKLETNITSLFHLIMLWTQYTDIIYLPENAVQALKFGRLNVGDTSSSAAHEQQEYLKKVLDTGKKVEEFAYQTVEEGITTDTTDSSEGEVITPVQEESEEELPIGEDDGILSQLMAQEDGDEVQDGKILSFANEEMELDEERKQDIKYEYGLGDSDLRDFKAEVQREKIKSETDEMKSLTSQSNLTMFGIEESMEEKQRPKTEYEMEKYIKEQLEEISANLGAAENDYDNYIPDSGIDPYNPSDLLTENLVKGNNTSIVMDVYFDMLKDIPDGTLTENELETKKNLIKLVDYISQVRILDAPVLSEIYEMYRYK